MAEALAVTMLLFSHGLHAQPRCERVAEGKNSKGDEPMRRDQSCSIEIPRSLTEVVEDKIRQMIVSGDLEFGEQITETRLSEMFKLSKTPIREALLRLSSGERLVEAKPRCGTFIFSLTEKEISDISTLRIMLEQGAIRAAMKANRAALLVDLGKNLKASECLWEKIDLAVYRSLDHGFHRLFLIHADNPYLLDTYRMISTKVLAMRNRLTFSQEYVRKSIAEHRDIVQALCGDDLEQACGIVEKHINNGFTERTRRLLSGA